MRKKILWGLLAIFIFLQFLQPAKNAGNAQAITDITHAVAVSDSVLSLLQTACYDCHSDRTKYPWYSRITPVNWWLDDHILEGKTQLNFTKFNVYSNNRKMKELEGIRETIEKHEMPLKSYLWIHKEARLTKEQKKMIIEWTRTAATKVMNDSLRKVGIGIRVLNP